MAHATCLKKQPAKMFQTSSQTEQQDQQQRQQEDEVEGESGDMQPLTKKTSWKERMHKLDDKWSKFRPYVERLNGTIVPLKSREEEEMERRRRSVGSV